MSTELLIKRPKFLDEAMGSQHKMKLVAVLTKTCLAPVSHKVSDQFLDFCTISLQHKLGTYRRKEPCCHSLIIRNQSPRDLTLLETMHVKITAVDPPTVKAILVYKGLKRD